MRQVYRIVTISDYPPNKDVQLGGEYADFSQAEEVLLSYEWIGTEVRVQSRIVSNWEDVNYG